MSSKIKKYKFKSEVWLYPGMAGWHFVSVSKKESKQIKKDFGVFAKGWGSIPVQVTIGTSKWRTSIFPDKRTETYLLPVKAVIRKKERIFDKDKIVVQIEIKL